MLHVELCRGLISGIIECNDQVKLLDIFELPHGMRTRLGDNTPGKFLAWGSIFLKTQFWVKFCIHIRFLKRKNLVNTSIKTLSKRIVFEALPVSVSNWEFDRFLVLIFQSHLACQSYRPDKLIWNNFYTSFPCAWIWNNDYFVHLGKISLFICFAMHGYSNLSRPSPFPPPPPFSLKLSIFTI